MPVYQSSERIRKNIREQPHKAEHDRVHIPTWRQITSQTVISVVNWVQKQPWHYQPWNNPWPLIGAQAKEEYDGR